MRLNIGTKLISGFVFVSLLVALAGVLGIYNIGVVGRAGDVILHDKVPVADMSMEGTIDIISARDALGEFLLTEDTEKLESIESDFFEFNSLFDRHVDAIIKGDSEMGVNPVDAGSEIAKSVLGVQKFHEEFESSAKEMIEHHREHIQAEAQAGDLMNLFDDDAQQLADLLADYEERLTSNKKLAIDKKVDASMEAKSLMYKLKALAEEYVALENASKKELREEFMKTAREFETLRSDLPYEVVQKYEEFKDLAIGKGKMFDLKDQAIELEDHTREHMEAVDKLGAQVDQAMAYVEEAAGKEMHQAMARADQAEASSRSTLIIVTLLALLSGVFIGIFITKGITNPLTLCVDFARQVARGDLSKQVEINTKDETRDLGDALNDMFGYLRGMANVADSISNGDLSMAVKPASEHDVFGNSFSKMIGSLKDMVSRVRKSSESVASAADEISAATDQITKGAQNQASASEETGSTMEEMSVQIQNVAKNAEGLSSNVDETTSSIQQMGTTADGVAKMAESMASNVSETSSTIEQMIVTIEKTAKNVEEADRLSKQASDEATNGGEAVMKMVEGMKVLGDMMSNISGVIQNLGKRSEAIGSIVKVIEEIADQTNLLALNAAIEAARAGEAGQGFAVVADEVRKLAERSVKATKEIGDVIKQVQTETDSAVKATEEGAKSSGEGLALADQAGEAISKIMESVKSTSNIMQEISGATSEQSTAAKNVVTAVEEMNRLTQSVTQSTNEQAAGIQQVVKAAEAMSQMTEQVKNATSEQKKGGDNVVKAVENISEIAKGNLSAVEQLSRSAKDMANQSEDLQEMVQAFRTE